MLRLKSFQIMDTVCSCVVLMLDIMFLIRCLLSLLCCSLSLAALFSATIFRSSINYVFDKFILTILKYLVSTLVCSTVSPFIVYDTLTSELWAEVNNMVRNVTLFYTRIFIKYLHTYGEACKIIKVDYKTLP
jgi:hypothetical protein